MLDFDWITLITQHMRADDRLASGPGETYAIDSNLLPAIYRASLEDRLQFEGLVGAGLIALEKPFEGLEKWT